MPKQIFTRDEVKALLREAIGRIHPRPPTRRERSMNIQIMNAKSNPTLAKAQYNLSRMKNPSARKAEKTHLRKKGLNVE